MDRGTHRGWIQGRAPRPIRERIDGRIRSRTRRLPCSILAGWIRANAVVSVVLTSMIVTGCTEGPRQTNRRYREVGLAAFASPEAAAQAPAVDADETESDMVSDEPWFDDDEYVAVPMEPGERTVVDSMVGQVNGQPIFADAFFDPIEDERRVNRGFENREALFYVTS